MTFIRPSDESSRAERIRTTLRNKLPKLLAAGPADARTILLLEDRDIAMSNPAVVSQALLTASGSNTLPDAIYSLNPLSGPSIIQLFERPTWTFLMGVDGPHLRGEDGSEPPVGQHSSFQCEQHYVQSVRRPVGEVDLGWLLG